LTELYHLKGKDGLPGNLFEACRAYYQHDWQWYYHKVIKMIPDRSKILDIGAGRGGLASYLQSIRYCDVTVCDMSDEAIVLCKQKGLKTIKADIENEPIKGKYDLILMTAVLEHLINPRHILWKLRDNLVDGGHIILAQSNFNDLLSRIRYLIGYGAKYYEEPATSLDRGVAPSAHLHLFDKDTLNRVLQLEGYKAVQWEYSTQPYSDAIANNPNWGLLRKFVSRSYHTLYNSINNPLFSEIVIVKAIRE
jgi:2-polyprenyl-3-methyl-5-hydroxy-6-metoxy-1,4-benzoquinol methylase